MQPVIKWSGGKRTQADTIFSYFPSDFESYYEPFIGGGSMMYRTQPKHGICGDICEPLIELWNLIKTSPEEVAEGYRKEWETLQDKGQSHFYDVRTRFNEKKNGQDLLFLSRTCVNGLIRFNADGDFNNSFHLTRKGIAPEKMKKIIIDWSDKIQNVDFLCGDYENTTSGATKNDFVYLDPPYFNTKGRYYGTIGYERFLGYLEDLNTRGIRFALSFDGKRGDEDFTKDIPKELYKQHLYIPSGNSSFKKVMGGENLQVLESLYLNYVP